MSLTIADVAARLLAGDVIVFVDEHGRAWRASADRLELELGGEYGPVFKGCTAREIAEQIVRQAHER